MLLESEKPLVYRWPGGEVRLVPGCPVELPDERGKKLLARAGDKVRVLEVPKPDSPMPETICQICTGRLWWRVPGTPWTCSRCLPMSEDGPCETVYIPEGFDRAQTPLLSGCLCRGCGSIVPNLYRLGKMMWRCLACVEKRPVEPSSEVSREFPGNTL